MMPKLPKPLLALLAGFTLLTAVYAYLIPPFEGPDGPEHFAYITWLAEGRGFPPQGAAAWDTPVRQEAGQPPLYYLLAAVPARLVSGPSNSLSPLFSASSAPSTVQSFLNNPPAVYRSNPHFPSTAPGTIADNKNRAIHYPADANPLRGGWLALYLARAVSLFFGLLLVASTYGLARQTFPGNPNLALGAAALVAANPQIIFLSSVESNDIAAAATSALTLWLLARLLRLGPTPARSLALGLAFALALLSKISTLTLALPIALALTYSVFRIAYSVSPNTQYAIRNSRHASPITHHASRSTLFALRSTLFAPLFTLLLAGWWFGRSWLLYGTPFGLNTHDYAPWAITEPATLPPRLAEWVEVFYSYWAAFGWGNIKYPGWLYTLLALLCLAAVAGLIRLTWHNLHPSSPITPITPPASRITHHASRITLFSSPTRVLVIALFLTILAVAAALELWMQRVIAPHGRLLFPAAAAISVLLAAGWQAIHRWLLWGGVGGVAALALLSPVLLIHPAYALPTPLTAAEVAPQIDTPLGWRFGEIAELTGTAVLEPSVAAGSVLPIRLCWRVLSAAAADYTVFVNIVGPNDAVVANRRTYPGLGSYPTSSWRPDTHFCDVVRLDIPTDLAQTLLYKVEVGLLNQTTAERLPVYESDGTPRPDTFANAVRLVAVPAEALTPTPAGSDPIRLLATDVLATWRPGQSHDVTLHWWAAEPLPTDYTVYLHLRDQATGETIAQADGPPLDGWYPTTAWTAGETITDRHTFLLPATIPPGRYDLYTGWYDPITNQRLTTDHHLATIEVLP